MKNKERKNLAQKIAKIELELKNPDISAKDKERLENETIKLCGHVHTIEDMVLIDDMVRAIIKKAENS